MTIETTFPLKLILQIVLAVTIVTGYGTIYYTQQQQTESIRQLIEIANNSSYVAPDNLNQITGGITRERGDKGLYEYGIFFSLDFHIMGEVTNETYVMAIQKYLTERFEYLAKEPLQRTTLNVKAYQFEKDVIEQPGNHEALDILIVMSFQEGSDNRSVLLTLVSNKAKISSHIEVPVSWIEQYNAGQTTATPNEEVEKTMKLFYEKISEYYYLSSVD